MTKLALVLIPLLLVSYANCRVFLPDSDTSTDQSLQLNSTDVISILRGVVESWAAYNETVSKLQGCVTSISDIEKRVLYMIWLIKNLDPSDLRGLIRSIARMIWVVQSCLNKTVACIDSADDILILVNKVAVLSVDQIVRRLYLNFIKNGKQINDNVKAIINATTFEDFYTVGYKSGEIVELLIFSEPSTEWDDPLVAESLRRLLHT